MLKEKNAYCFLGGLVPDRNKKEIELNSKCTPQFAVETFQRALLLGLKEVFEKIDIINLPFIGSYPINYKSLFSPKGYSESIEIEGSTYNVHNVRFCNLIFFKFYFRRKSAIKALRSYLISKMDKDKVYVFVYSIHLPFLRALTRLKNEFKNLRIITIVPDLPDYKNDDLPWYKAMLLNYDTHVTSNDYMVSDGYILLSDHMKHEVINRNQPYTVIEGIFNSDPKRCYCPISNSDNKIVFYSGTLARRYNIMNLVDAFMSIKRDDIRLVICGNGSCRDEIIEKSQIDSRISYRGSLPHEDILRLQKESFLLVNPRTPEGNYTKYSFPSKTMEYLASGRPTLIYRLDGIPEEYYKYCYSLEDTSIEALAAKINYILNLPLEKIQDIGLQAQKFIFDKKNPRSQCGRIEQLLTQIP